MARAISKNTNFTSGEKQELERFAAAAARLVQRAKSDKSVALRVLRDVGYITTKSAAKGANGSAVQSSAKSLKAKSPRTSTISSRKSGQTKTK